MTKPVGKRLCKKGRTVWSVLFALCGVQPQGAPLRTDEWQNFVGGGVLDAPPGCSFMLRVGGDAHIAPPVADL